ncbi:hypothetical protein [Stappia sp. ICDLI1TA098]
MSKGKKVTLRLPVTVVMGADTYAPGVPVPMDAETAEEMRLRYRELPPEQAVATVTPPRKPKGDGLIKAICAAIEGLDPEEDFTLTGLPSMSALERALGYDITADERAAALDAGTSASGQLGV